MFRGTFTALITPFTPDGAVDLDGFRQNLALQAEAKVAGVVVNGTTGEPPTLSEKEAESLITAAVDELHGKAKVIVGAGSNATTESVALARRAEVLGADGVLVVTPYYNRPSDEGVYRHFRAVAEATALPLIVYNIQSRTGKNLGPELMERIAALPHVVADKEASGSAAQCGAIIERCSRFGNFSVLSGDDALALPFIAMGATGLVSVISNAVPETVVRFVDAALAGDLDTARKLQYGVILPLTRLAFIDTNPVPIKYICARLGMAAGGYRLPLCELDDEKKKQVDAGLASLGLV